MYKGVGGENRWTARGKLQLLSRTFGSSMSPRSVNHKPRQAKRHLTNRDEYQTHTSYLVLFMDPIVSAVTLHGRQKHLWKSNRPSVTFWSAFQYPITYT